ncbi:hypothetical protein Pcinc_004272 [Petrolisthes cinctipes]|uniref:Uncharacterized protein n=1 Tax=Petrolisthes cinctipes TaxID=88211 RepID=A0AAE1L1M0_PETCI|nr:hypothetical protein Pcinc_004272 [Petrolisthes cinctipes]
MCDETNRYRQQCVPAGLELFGLPKMISWIRLTVREMYVFKKLKLEEHWYLEDVIHTPIFSKQMFRDHFRQIHSYLHSADNTYPSATDPLWILKI